MAELIWEPTRLTVELTVYGNLRALNKTPMWVLPIISSKNRLKKRTMQ